MAGKRVASSSTGLMPKAKQAALKGLASQKRQEETVLRSRKSIEEASLVEYVNKNGFVDHWPAKKKP